VGVGGGVWGGGGGGGGFGGVGGCGGGVFLGWGGGGGGLGGGGWGGFSLLLFGFLAPQAVCRPLKFLPPSFRDIKGSPNKKDPFFTVSLPARCNFRVLSLLLLRVGIISPFFP